MHLVEASRNGEEGIDLEEDDDFEGGGDLVAVLTRVTAKQNRGGDAGIKLRERGEGLADATLKHILAADNLTSGIQVRESNPGNLIALIEHAVSTGNQNHGVDLQESSDGDLTGTVRHATLADNGGAGISASESGNGAGAVTLDKVGFGGGNTGGNTAGGVPFTILP
jgi:hypothetical protein